MKKILSTTLPLPVMLFVCLSTHAQVMPALTPKYQQLEINASLQVKNLLA